MLCNAVRRAVVVIGSDPIIPTDLLSYYSIFDASIRQPPRLLMVTGELQRHYHAVAYESITFKGLRWEGA